MSESAKKRFLCNLCFKFIFGETEFHNHKRDVHNEVSDEDDEDDESEDNEQEMEMEPSNPATATTIDITSANETPETEKSPAPKLMLGRTPKPDNRTPPTRRGRKPGSTKLASIKTEVIGKQSKISDFFGRGKDAVVTLESSDEEVEEAVPPAKKRPANRVGDNEAEEANEADKNICGTEERLEKKLKLDPDVIKVEIPVETIDDGTDDNDDSEKEVLKDVKPRMRMRKPKKEEEESSEEEKEMDWLTLLTREEVADSFTFFPAKHGYPENILEKAFVAYVKVSRCAETGSDSGAKKADHLSVRSESERVSLMSDVGEEDEGDNECDSVDDRKKMDKPKESEKDEMSDKDEDSEQAEESDEEENSSGTEEATNENQVNSKTVSEEEDESGEEEEDSASAQSSDSETASNSRRRKSPPVPVRKTSPTMQTNQKLSQLRVVAKTGRGRGRKNKP